MSQRKQSRAARRNSGSIWRDSESELDDVLDEANGLADGRYPPDDDDQYDDDDDNYDEPWDDDDDDDQFDDDIDSDDVDLIDWDKDFVIEDDDEVVVDSLYPPAVADHRSNAPLWSTGIPTML